MIHMLTIFCILGLLPTLDINLIVLNWDSYSFFNLSYSRNVTAPRLAKIVNQFIKHLFAHGANPKQMYLVGFSTGAQIVGLAAKNIHPKISRILGKYYVWKLSSTGWKNNLWTSRKQYCQIFRIIYKAENIVREHYYV